MDVLQDIYRRDTPFIHSRFLEICCNGVFHSQRKREWSIILRSNRIEVLTFVFGWNIMSPIMDEEKDIDINEEKAANSAFYEAFSLARPKLERIVEFRMHPRLRSRLDPSDVLQEAYLQMSKRVGETTQEMPVTLFVWMRQKTIQTLVDLQRAHFRDKRDVMKEKRDWSVENGQTSSLSIARYLIDDITSPSLAAARSEDLELLHQALDSMNEIDREVLAMRHFEQLSNAEVAEALDLTPTAASNRYIRAVTRLGEIIKALPAKPK